MRAVTPTSCDGPHGLVASGAAHATAPRVKRIMFE